MDEATIDACILVLRTQQQLLKSMQGIERRTLTSAIENLKALKS